MQPASVHRLWPLAKQGIGIPTTVVVEKRLPNPDPANYRILYSEQIGPYLLLAVWYPDCNNYEGRKVLMFKGTNLEKIKSQKLIDPHFSQNTIFHSPIARFEPTARGWKMAQVLAHSMLAYA